MTEYCQDSTNTRTRRIWSTTCSVSEFINENLLYSREHLYSYLLDMPRIHIEKKMRLKTKTGKNRSVVMICALKLSYTNTYINEKQLFTISTRKRFKMPRRTRKHDIIIYVLFIISIGSRSSSNRVFNFKILIGFCSLKVCIYVFSVFHSNVINFITLSFKPPLTAKCSRLV